MKGKPYLSGLKSQVSRQYTLMKNRNPLQLQEDLAKAGIDPVAHDGFYWGYFIARASGLDYKMAKGSITEITDVYLTPAKS